MKIIVSKFIISPLVFTFALTVQSWAVSYTYSNIQVPGSTGTSPTGINNKGEVVGNYQSSNGVFGFVLSNGTYTTISCPSATTGTFAVGINDNGVIVGYYGTTLQNHGFVYTNGTCRTLPDFNGAATYPSGINNSGVIVGYYIVNNVSHGFELQGGTYKEVSAPNSTQTIAFGINSSGDISGTYYETAITPHGFLLHNGTYHTIDVPNSGSTTQGAGLNNEDLTVGSYKDPNSLTYEGYVTNTTKFFELVFPGSVTTFPVAINDSNVIVGNYFNGGVNPNGFMATPSAQ